MGPAIPSTLYDGNPIALFEPTLECCANLGERIFSEDPEVNLGGVAWAKATYNTADDSMRLPDLDLYRVHLWGSSQLGPNWSGTFRLHAGTAPGVLSRYNQDGTIFVYQAFLDRKHLFSDADKVTLGLATNAYLKRLYRLHGTRFISRLIAQRIGYLTPTPLGVRYELHNGEPSERYYLGDHSRPSRHANHPPRRCRVNASLESRATVDTERTCNLPPPFKCLSRSTI